MSLQTAQALTARKWNEDEAAGLAIFTPWTISPRSGSHLVLDDDERAKDLQFRGLVADLLIARMLWLLPILSAATGVVIATGGRLFVALPSEGFAMIELPGLEQFLPLLPWPEQEALAH